jgi:hypothetical protein
VATELAEASARPEDRTITQGEVAAQFRSGHFEILRGDGAVELIVPADKPL